MDVVKKNLVSIIAGVVALVAIVAIFVFVSPMQDALQTELNSVKKTAEDIGRISTTTYDGPDLGTGETVPLTSFPNPAIIREGQEAIEQVQQQSNDLLAFAIDQNRRVPLYPDDPEAARRMWPINQRTSTLNRRDFLVRYQRALNADNLFEDGAFPEGSIQRELLDGTRPPTQDEVSRVQEAVATKIESEAPIRDGQLLDPEGVKRRIDEAVAEVAATLKFDRARSHKVYVEPNGPQSGFTIHPAFMSVEPPSEATAFFNAQVGYWIQEAVATNLARANANATSILDAPVKHLYGVYVDHDFTDGSIPAGGTTASRASGGTAAANARRSRRGVDAEDPAQQVQLTVDPAAEVTPDYTVSFTGRKSNPFYDVERFTMTLRVDATKVAQVLDELQRNSFITVLDVDMRVVDAGVALSQGYIYGDAPVIQLDLTCEMLFLRSWLSNYMPPEIKTALEEAANAPQDPDAGSGSYDPYDPYGGDFGGQGGYGPPPGYGGPY